MQNFWVNPADVKKTDIVIGNRQNLIPSLSSIPKPAKGTWDKAYFDVLMAQKDKAPAIEYLKDCGVVWTPSTDKGINCMRALMSATKMGLLPKKSGSKPKSTSSSTPNPTPAPAVAPTPNSTVQSTNITPSDTLTPYLDELKKLSDGKEMVKYLKKQVGNGDSIIKLAENMGVTWTKSPNSNINIMRLSMSMAKYLDSLGIGTGVPGAPKGNQNAKKDKKDKPDKPPVDPTLLVIPNGASEAKANYITLLNSIKDEDLLKTIAKAGIIPEDDTAKSFLTNKLWSEYSQTIRKKSNTPASSNGLCRYNYDYQGGYMLRDDLLQVFNPIFKGMSKKAIDKALFQSTKSKDGCYGINAQSDLALVYPREFFSYRRTDTQTNSCISISEFLMATRGFSTYAGDNCDTLGIKAGSYDTVKYDPSKEGFNIVLDHIASQQPELSDKCEELKEKYSKLMETCDGNISQVYQILQSNSDLKYYERTKERIENYEIAYNLFQKSWEQQGFNQEELKKTMEALCVDQLTYSYTNIPVPVYSVDSVNGTIKLRVLDSNGNPKLDSNGQPIWFESNGTYDEFEIGFKSDPPVQAPGVDIKLHDLLGNSSMYGNSNWVSSLATEYVVRHPGEIDLDKLSNNRGASYSYTSIVDQRNKLINQSLITKEKYNQVHKCAMDLLQVKLVDSSSSVDITDDFSDITRSDTYSMVVVPNGEDKKADSIFMNFHNIIRTDNLCRNLADRADLNPRSKANDNGDDYSRNYDYYGTQVTWSNWDDRFNTREYTPTVYGTGKALDRTPTVINNRILSQLHNIKIYSLGEYTSLVDYCDKNGSTNIGVSSTVGRPDTKQKYAKVLDCSSLYRTLADNDNISPLRNIMLDTMLLATTYCPQNYTNKIDTPDKVIEWANDSITNLNSKTNKNGYKLKRFGVVPQVTPVVAKVPPNQLLQLRQDALKAVHCTIKTVDDTKRTEIEHEVKMDFDRIDPKTGKRIHKAERVYDDRTMVFSGVYEIKNSSMEDAFKAECENLKEKPVTRYHGTSYTGACGIMGVDGRFRYKDSDRVGGQKGSGSMLGEGIYVAKLVGKTLPYIGSTPYTYNHYTANDVTTPNNNANGVLLVMDTVLGHHGEFNDSWEARRNNKNNGGTYDSVAVGAGALMPGGTGRVKEYEAIVTRNSMVLPRYMVDCGGRRR